MKPRIVKDAGEWMAIIDEDIIIQNKDPEFVAGYLAAYQQDQCAKQDRIVALALEWKHSGFKGRQELALVKYLQEEVS